MAEAHDLGPAIVAEAVTPTMPLVATAIPDPRLVPTTSAEDSPLQAGCKEFNEQVIHQVEHYFSDENLVNDAHLLGKLAEAKYGPGLVSIAQILSYPRMRKYKPKGAVVAALKDSTTLEVVEGKYVKRKIPFDMAKAQVQPQLKQEQVNAQKASLMANNPHLTKGMLKPTGFEHEFSEKKLTQEDIQEDLDDFDITRPVYVRLETAVSRFRQNRKFHQETARLFSAFLDYCGLSTSVPMFTGGISKEEMEGWSKEEKRRAKQTDYVAECVIDSIEAGDGSWVVDIETTTKGFLSSRFPGQFAWYEPEVSKGACNILRNWFNYLLHHNALAEYNHQICAALAAIDLAEKEFVILAKAQFGLPGAFNTACSVLQGGSFSNLHYSGSWMTAEEAAVSQIGYSREDAKFIVISGIVAYGNEMQVAAAKVAGGIFETASREKDVGLEVTGIVHIAEASAKAQLTFKALAGTVVPPLGRLLCKRYKFPMAAPQDLPAVLPKEYQEFEFLVDEKTLENCFVGMKMEVNVMKLDVGLAWIDHIHQVYGSFYTWCWNEVIKDWKKPGPPKECKCKSGFCHVLNTPADIQRDLGMKRQQAKKDSGDDTAVGVLGDQENADDGYVVGQENGPDQGQWRTRAKISCTSPWWRPE